MIRGAMAEPPSWKKSRSGSQSSTSSHASVSPRSLFGSLPGDVRGFSDAHELPHHRGVLQRPAVVLAAHDLADQTVLDDGEHHIRRTMRRQPRGIDMKGERVFDRSQKPGQRAADPLTTGCSPCTGKTCFSCHSPFCWRSFATSPVQPVWWLAPTPEPSSPSKYSWNRR